MDNLNNKKILSIILTIIIVLCLAGVGTLCFNSYLAYKQTKELLESLQVTASPSPVPGQESGGAALEAEPSPSAEAPGRTEPPSQTEVPEQPTPSPEPSAVPTVPNPYADSFLANEDMAAWLVVPGTNIDYPVMWTPRDEQYYLYRSFDGSENKNGCLILDTDSCLEPLTTNLIIHGHNMKSGAMFGRLTDYEKESFYREHKQILLYTEECQRNYEVIAVFRSQVYRKTDDVFKFYKFFQADTQEEFDDFYQNIMALSEYDTGVTAEFGDRFITLSTCVYHVEQGRLVVVAKEIEEGEHYSPVR